MGTPQVFNVDNPVQAAEGVPRLCGKRGARPNNNLKNRLFSRLIKNYYTQ